MTTCWLNQVHIYSKSEKKDEEKGRKKNACGAGNIQACNINADRRARLSIRHPLVITKYQRHSLRPLRLVPIRILQECAQDLAARLEQRVARNDAEEALETLPSSLDDLI